MEREQEGVQLGDQRVQRVRAPERQLGEVSRARQERELVATAQILGDRELAERRRGEEADASRNSDRPPDLEAFT